MARTNREAAAARPSRAAIARRGIPLFRMHGIQVRLDYTWFVIFLLVWVSLAAGYFPSTHPGDAASTYWAAGAVASLLFFASILVHELSHAFAAISAGIPVPAITLFLFGGVSEMSREPQSPAAELRIAAVGPLASFALASIFWLLYTALAPAVPPLFAGVAFYLAWINAALCVFNLLPGMPLDGGRILRAAVWWRTGSLRRASRTAAHAGKVVAVGLMLLGGLEILGGALIGGLWLILIGVFLRGTAEVGYRHVVIAESLQTTRVRDVAIPQPLHVPPQLDLQSLVDDYFLKYGYRAYPVVDGSDPIGLISIDALRDIAPETRRTLSIKDRMTPVSDALLVAPDLPLSEARAKLAAAPGGRLLVVDGGELVGLLTRNGLARFIEIRHVLESGAR